MSLSPDADALLSRAASTEHAVDLYLAPGATRLVADRLVEIMLRAPLEPLSERALWNTLFAAGELSLQVDVFRAADLFRAAVALCARVAPTLGPAGDPRAAALEMCFDFFFARGRHPLLPLRQREVLAGLAGLLDGPRASARAALHGLGHLVALAHACQLPALADETAAILDDYARAHAGDPDLAAFVDEARTGAVP